MRFSWIGEDEWVGKMGDIGIVAAIQDNSGVRRVEEIDVDALLEYSWAVCSAADEELSAAKQKLMLLDNVAEARLMLLSHINAA
nr:hypothetical protein [Tanacetum cinerariifolium]